MCTNFSQHKCTIHRYWNCCLTCMKRKDHHLEVLAKTVMAGPGGLGYHRGRISGPTCIEISNSYCILYNNYSFGIT